MTTIEIQVLTIFPQPSVIYLSFSAEIEFITSHLKCMILVHGDDSLERDFLLIQECLCIGVQFIIL